PHLPSFPTRRSSDLRCACFLAKGEAAPLLAVKFSSSGEVDFTTLLRDNLTSYFTLDRGRHYENQSDESSRRTKLCAAQAAPGAGATLRRTVRHGCRVVAPALTGTSGSRFAR